MQNWHPPQTIHDQSEMLQGMTDLERYFEGRDKVVPYTPPAETGQVQPYNSPGEAIADIATALAQTAVQLSKPVGTLAAIAGAGYFMLSAIGGACAAAMAWGAANASMIGAGLVGIVAVWVAKSSLMDRRAKPSENKDTPPPPNDGGKWEWYQEQSQRQGWRKV